MVHSGWLVLRLTCECDFLERIKSVSTFISEFRSTICWSGSLDELEFEISGNLLDVMLLGVDGRWLGDVEANEDVDDVDDDGLEEEGGEDTE